MKGGPPLPNVPGKMVHIIRKQVFGRGVHMPKGSEAFGKSTRYNSYNASGVSFANKASTAEDKSHRSSLMQPSSIEPTKMSWIEVLDIKDLQGCVKLPKEKESADNRYPPNAGQARALKDAERPLYQYIV